ncbi:MAG: glutaredoxin 3 [Alphaproteobacteria bacterium]|nr:glutaredoxin 3 [Alphaproteobacteria bacterium]
MPDIIVYSGPNCPYCLRAKALLEKKGVTYTEHNVQGDPALLREMLQRSGGKRTIPQIFIGAQHIGGFDDLYALDRAGRLDPLLQGDP